MSTCRRDRHCHRRYLGSDRDALLLHPSGSSCSSSSDRSSCVVREISTIPSEQREGRFVHRAHIGHSSSSSSTSHLQNDQVSIASRQRCAKTNHLLDHRILHHCLHSTSAHHLLSHLHDSRIAHQARQVHSTRSAHSGHTREASGHSWEGSSGGTTSRSGRYGVSFRVIRVPFGVGGRKSRSHGRERRLHSFVLHSTSASGRGYKA